MSERITDDELRALREMLAEGHPCDITNAMAYNALPALLDEVERLRGLWTLPADVESAVLAQLGRAS